MFYNNYPEAYFFYDFRSFLETPGVVIWEATGAEKHVPQVSPTGRHQISYSLLLEWFWLKFLFLPLLWEFYDRSACPQ